MSQQVFNSLLNPKDSNSSGEIRWTTQKFEDLSALELYAILNLRSEVFVVEQKCVYLDTDGKDIGALHVTGWSGDEIIACSRLLRKGVSYEDYQSIGRIVVSPKHRGRSYGRLLVQKSIKDIRSFYGNCAIKIGAQSYLRKFYNEFGFEQSGEEYIEDEIPHIPMILKNSFTTIVVDLTEQLPANL